MNNHKQYGFGIIEVVILIFIIGLVGLIGFRLFATQDTKQPDREPQSQQQKTVKPDDLVLKNVGMRSLNSVLISNDALREYDSQGLKGFYAFGDKLGATERISPNFEFSSLKPDTKIVAAIDGTVVFIKEQPGSNDSEVFLQPFDGSAWMVGYDHLTNVGVKKGDMVKAGDVLGEPALQGNGLPRFELQVNKKQADGTELSYCPSALLDVSVRDAVQGELSTMMQQWESFSGRDLYDLAAQKPVGCLAETVKP